MNDEILSEAKPRFGWFLGLAAGSIAGGVFFGSFFVPEVPPGVTDCMAPAFAQLGAIIEGAFYGSLAGAVVGYNLDIWRCNSINRESEDNVYTSKHLDREGSI